MKIKKVRRTFSKSFKKEKVRLLETGKIRVHELVKMYDVSTTSVYNWKKLYGRFPSREQVVIETDSDYLKLLKLKKEMSNMENLLGRQQMQVDYYRTLVVEANKHYEEDIEKKFGKE
jgi:transposase-like protein